MKSTQINLYATICIVLQSLNHNAISKEGKSVVRVVMTANSRPDPCPCPY